MNTNRLANSLCVLTVLLALPVLEARATDYFLTLGGGYSPTGNQISLEKNVLFFRKVLADSHMDGAPHNIFFADGNNVARDLQFKDPNFKIPTANRLLAEVMRQERYLGYQYRTHEVPSVEGEYNPDNIKRWFAEVGGKLKKGDRLMIYLTGHGGRGDKKTPTDTKFVTWRGKSLKVSEFVTLLDKVPTDVPVTMVMVQCYAGGFANVIFNEGSAKKGVSGANRCGFYATTHSRVAAGCTPDINEADYQEYSSFFWAAQLGRTRVGKKIDPPDYNGDGAVSFDEAHAFSILTAETLDIPVKTSDAYLRFASKTVVKDRKDLLTAESPYDKLLAHATPSEKAILEGLSGRLKLKGANRGKAAKDLATKISKQKKDLDTKRGKLRREVDAALNTIRQSVRGRWPELANRWDPQVQKLLNGEANSIVKLIESHPSYSAYSRKRDEVKKLSKQKLDLDRRWVKAQRVLRTLENVALAANLPKLADRQSQQRYQQLLRSESQTLAK